MPTSLGLSLSLSDEVEQEREVVEEVVLEECGEVSEEETEIGEGAEGGSG